jgi:hypothetical protein
MLKPLMLTGFFLLHGLSWASNLDDPGAAARALVQASSAPIAIVVPDDDCCNVASGGSDKHQQLTRYLAVGVEQSNDPAFRTFERCLLTYIRLAIDEGKIKATEQIKAQINTLETFTLSSSGDYQKWAGFSHFMNRVLPKESTRFFGRLRWPFTYFCPAIDLNNAVLELKVTHPLAADFIEFLFNPDPHATLNNTMVQQIVHKGDKPATAVEMLTLFAMHHTPRANQTIDLEEEQVSQLERSFSGTSSLICSVMKDQLLGSKGQLQQIKSAEDFFYFSGEEAKVLGDIFSDDEDDVKTDDSW